MWRFSTKSDTDLVHCDPLRCHTHIPNESCLIAPDNTLTALPVMFSETLSDLQPCHLTEQRVKFFENVPVLVVREPEYLRRQSVPSLHAVQTVNTISTTS